MTDLVQDENGNVFSWPFCVIPGCPNRICLAKGEVRFCWPHSSSGLSVEEVIREASPVKSPERQPTALLRG